jgi:predicted alpha/beta superfamily hydrolase
VPDRIDGVELGGQADAYAELVDGLRSRMEEEYGVPRMSGLMGSSLGGLVSLVIAELQPGRWDMALSLSGTAGWGSIGVDGETVLDRYADLGPGGTRIYVDSGGGGPCEDRDGDGLQDDHPDSSDNFCENRQLADQLAAQGYQWEVDLYHWHEAGAPHNEQAWAARVSRPLALFAAR